jgi:arylsulfatase A-like enzyme
VTRRLIPALLVVAVALAALAGCRPAPKPVDLMAVPAAMTAGHIAGGREGDWVRGQFGKPVRIEDVVLRTLPASPPSVLRFAVDIPKGARLTFACAIAPERQGEPGVEFVVKVKRGAREQTVWSQLLDPLKHPEHRTWLPVDVDLSRQAGAGAELVLETRAFEVDDDPKRAYWGAPALTAPGAEAPLAIIYLVDTLRADHTQPYGYPRDTTPELLAFSKDAVVFEQAVAHASWTKPSVASILTSQLPGRHRAVQLRDTLDPGLVTLPEMLKEKGFVTGASVANSVIYGAGVNFEQGFDHFAGIHGRDGRPSKQVDAATVVDDALRWLDARRGFPAFSYLHFMEPHVPYEPPPPFDRKFTPAPAEGRPAADPRSDYHEPLDRERLIAQYDGSIAYGDQQFGRFLRELKARGLYDRALIVFMADHGEEFLDHGQWTHGKTVFDELIHIPLVLKLPGQRHAGQRVAQQVQAADVLPTVLESLELPVPAPPIVVGRPLQAVLAGGAPEPPAVSEISHRGFVAHGMRTSRDKYVQRFSPDEDELYFDLLADPHERVNRIAERGERVRRLRAGVEAVMVPNPFRHNLKVVAPGRYVLKLRTGGWIEGVEAVGLGPDERAQSEGSGRKLALQLAPRAGRPREVAFGVRPMGAPVWLEGTRDGRPLRPADVWIAEEGHHPAAAPLKLPEVEPQGDDDKERLSINVFAAPRAQAPGVHLWLTMVPGRTLMKVDKETCERLRALGYIGTCPG